MLESSQLVQGKESTTEQPKLYHLGLYCKKGSRSGWAVKTSKEELSLTAMQF